MPRHDTRLEGTLESEDEGVSVLRVLAQHGQLGRDVIHRSVALDGRLVDDLHRVDLLIKLAAHL